MNSFSAIMTKFFGFENEKEKNLFHQMLESIDIKFFNWSKKAVVHWKNDENPKDFIHIQGTNDLVFPIENIRNAIAIPKGHHFMVYTRGAELSELILDKLGK